MYEVLEISDDEDSFELENDDGIIPKVEELSYDMPPPNMYPRHGVDDVASSSGTNLRSSFIGMGFAPSLVDKAIEENGGANHESLLETLFAYSDLQKLKTEIFDDGFSGGNDNLAANQHGKKASHESESRDRFFGGDTNKIAHFNANIPLKEEVDVGSEANDEKMATLLKMTFTSDEVGFAMRSLGKNASIGQLMDYIFAARMAKKYEKDPNYPLIKNEETEKDCSNEALFGIMEKTLQLLEMGFSENGISAAFAKCGSRATVTELADFIVAAGTGPNADKYLSKILSEPSVQRNSQSLKRRMGDWDSLCIKIEESSTDVVSQDDTSDKLEGWMPNEIHSDEPNNWKKPKEEVMEEPSSSVGRTWLEARRAKSSSTSNPVAAPLRQIRRTTSLEEDIKPLLSFPTCRSISSVVAKPPYFLYGNVTKLSHNSWVKISQFMYSVQPEFASSKLYSALNRTEGYVHNLPTEDRFHIFPKGPMTIQEALPHTKKWWPLWDDREQLSYINSEMTGISHLCNGLGRMMADCKGPPPAELQREVLQHCETNNLVWVGKDRLAPLELEHVERIMGYSVHHTQVAGFTAMERLKALRLSFQTDTLGYHLSVLKSFPDGVSVLSFFDGIGGVEVALHRLGIRLKGVVSVEPSEAKRRIVKKWWENSAQAGELIQLESINKLSSNKLEDLFKKFKGFNLVICQNPYSGVETENLDGLDFSMFVEFVRVLQRVRSMNRN
ncbi:hypothetical protein ACS0TY_027166 [Phlomoides rotata]